MSLLKSCLETGVDGGIAMGKARQLDLVDIPWPLSILKCNQRIVEMAPGDRLDVILVEDATKENLVMLLRKMADCAFDIRFCDGCYRLTVRKRKR